MIPTAIFYSGNVEGINLEERLNRKIGVESIYVSCSPVLYKVITALRETAVNFA